MFNNSCEKSRKIKHYFEQNLFKNINSESHSNYCLFFHTKKKKKKEKKKEPQAIESIPDIILNFHTGVK